MMHGSHMEGTECWETVRLYMASVADIGLEVWR